MGLLLHLICETLAVMFGGCAELDNGTFSSTHKEKKKKGIMKKSDITLFLEDAWQAWIP